MNAEGKRKFSTKPSANLRLWGDSPHNINRRIFVDGINELNRLTDYCEPPNKKEALQALIYGALFGIDKLDKYDDLTYYIGSFLINYLKLASVNEINPYWCECVKKQLLWLVEVEPVDVLTKIIINIMERLSNETTG